MKKNRHHTIRLWVFAIPVGLLLFVLAVSLTSGDSFLSAMTAINNEILSAFGWLYSAVTLGTMIFVFVLMFSKFGKTVIGGPEAKQKLRNIDIFAIILCSIVGIGMVTMGTAEIMAHYTAPPAFSGVSAYSEGAANFAIRIIYLHWTFPAYALYALPSILFSFAYYNMHCPYSVTSYLAPLLGKQIHFRIRTVIDIICIFSLMCGMISTIGAAVLSLVGGMSYLSDNAITKNSFVFAVVILALVLTFIISSITGVMKGIRLLSNLNLVFFILLAAAALIFGPTRFILNYGIEGFGAFLQNFFSDMLRTNAVSGDKWAYWWSIFYWAAYLAWSLVSSMFIGKICYGQTIRKIALLTMVLPSIFSGIWMAIFSGTSMYHELHGGGIADAYLSGYENTAYAVFEKLPASLLIILIFLLVMALSVITAADSTTDVLASMIVDNEIIEPTEPGKQSVKNIFKVIYGAIIGVSSYIIITYADFAGVKMICNIGALPSLIIEICIMAGVFRIMTNPEKYDDYRKEK